jgi:2'-5' RNA ligase
MTRLRAFLAAEIGEAARRAAAAAVERLARAAGEDDVRWAHPETYHATLRFLGDVPEERIAPLAARVGEAVAPVAPFELHLAGPVAFPSARRPRVIAAALEPEAPLVDLARRVEEGVVRAGFAAADRPFRPHLTLGRVRGRAHPDLAAAALATAPFRVSEVVLFRSELRPRGAVHTPLERIPLGGERPATRTSEGEARDQERANR